MLLEHELKKKQEQFLRRKEFLIATLSGNVKSVLRRCIRLKDNQAHELLQTDWLDCNKNIEAQWAARLTGKTGESEEVYKAFLINVNDLWQKLCNAHSYLNPMLLILSARPGETLPNDESTAVTYLNRNLNIWKNKLGNNSLNTIDLSQIYDVRKTIKTILIKYHSDKNKDTNSEIKERITRMAGELLQLMSECSARLNKPMAETVRREAPSASAPVAPASDPGSSQMVIYQKSVFAKDDMKDGMSRVLSFYQSWLRGAEQRHFDREQISDKNYDAIYGRNRKFLDSFYQSLFRISCYQEKIPLSIAQQMKRRNELFDTLSEVTKHALAYCISCKVLGEFVEKLMSFPDPERDRFHFDCLLAFFLTPRFKNRSHANLNETDIEKYSRLLKLEMEIALAFPEQNAEQSKDVIPFLRRLGECIERDFWTDFDDHFASRIKQVLTRSLRTFKIFVTHTNANDFGLLINLIRQANPATADQRLNALLTYLEKYADILNGLPHPLRPLIKLFLTDNGLQPINVDDLPPPNCLQDVIVHPEIIAEFWNFINERKSLSIKSLNDLIEMLKDSDMTEDVRKKFVGILFKLPPYISLDYIVKELKFMPGRYELTDCLAHLAKIKEAGEAFNQYITCRKEPDLEQEKMCFNTMTTEQNIIFFDWLNKNQQNNFHPLLLKLAATTNSMSKEIGKNWVASLFNLVTQLSSLSSHFIVPIANELLHDLGNINNEQNIERKRASIEQFNAKISSYSKFIDEIKAGKLQLPDNTLVWLFKLWKLESPIDRDIVLKNNLTVINKLLDPATQLPADFNSLTLYNELSAAAANVQAQIENNRRHLDFIELSNEPHNKVLGVKLKNIYLAYVRDKTITNVEQLTNAIAAVHDAKELDDKGNYDALFSEKPTNKNRIKRVRILQHLECGLLAGLGNSFKDRCYNAYKRLANHLTSPEKLPQQRHAGYFKDSFSELSAFTAEISQIAKHGYRINPADHE